MNCPNCQSSNRAGAHFCANCRAPLFLQNKYRTVRLLGRGGYGAVYLADQINLGVPYAVKELLPDANAAPEELERAAQQFLFEARILARLSDAALPKVTDFFQEGGRYYLVMEYVEGETLEERLRRIGTPLREAEVVEWAKVLCDTLTYLHTQQPPIIHRDIKPSNIKITPDGKLKLLDFGIAKLLQTGSGTGTAARAVSAPYAPFEQYGKGTDARSDLYALGVTLYELLTNHLPPDAPDRLNEQVIPPRQWNPLLAQNVQAVILKAIAERQSDRYQSATEMKQALSESTRTVLIQQTSQVADSSAANAATTTGTPNIVARKMISFGIGIIILALLSIAIFAWTQAQSAVLTQPSPVPIAAAQATTLPSSATPSVTQITPAIVLPSVTQITPTIVLPTATPHTQVAVPIVIGLPVENAASILRQAGFGIDQVQQETASCDNLMISRQDPTMGSTAPWGSAVRVFTCIGPTSTPRSTHTPTFTATAIPQARVVIPKANLYAGPSNHEFPILAELSQNQRVNPNGRFGDFARVNAMVNSKNISGYVPIAALDALPSNVRELNLNQAPWAVKSDLLHTLGFDNPDAIISGKRVPFPRVIPENSPIEFEIGMNSNAKEHGLWFLGRENTSSDWWTKVLLGVGRNGKNVDVNFWDGNSSNIPSQNFSMNPGNFFVRVENNGTRVIVYNPAHTELWRKDLSFSLFPRGYPTEIELYFVISAPGETISFSKLTVSVPPSGKYSP
jgi:serine/threonine-protein kinase